MANRRYIDFPIASSVGDSDIILIWQSGANKQTTKATFLSGLPTDLEDLNDVAISGLTNGQILRYDSVTGKWENTDQGNLDLNDLNDVSIVSPSNGQVLVYNSSTSKWENSSGGYVPYTGAVTTVNLGAQTIQAGSFVKAGGTAAQFLKANGSVDSNVYGTGTVTSVALTMPSAFSVANSPVTTAGTLAVTGAGTVGQYIRGDGSLADFPESSGGGSSVSYYLNGSVAQGTIGGVAYKELNKVPILGAGTDFTINADGYIASFITDAGDPNLLEIPAGNWNFETYFSASSNGGSPTFYVELYKVNSGGTATLIASNSTFPELIAFGTNVISYFSTLAVPTTALALTDRLAIRYYVIHSGRTITLHTEDNHLCQIITTFTTGITALNGLTAQVQNFAVGTSGTDFAIASATATHTFNLPTASATNRGALSSADWTTFNGKQNALTNPVTGTGTSGTIPIFTGSTTIGNSIIQSNSTQVNIVGNGSALLFDSSGETKSGGIQYVNSFELFIFNSRGTGSSINLGNANLDFNTNTTGNPRIRITNGGNVLVNSTSDNGAKFQVSGTARISGNLTLDTSSLILGLGNGGSNEAVYFNYNSNAASRSWRIIKDWTVFGDFQIQQSTTQTGTTYADILRFLPTGAAGFTNKVGVGGASPTYSITAYNPINGTTAAFGGTARGIRIDNDGTFSSGRSTIFGVDSSFYGSYQPLSIEASSLSLQVISGGNVLIGTTSDSGEKMQIRNGLSLFELASGTNGAILKLGRSAGAYYWHLGISGATSNFTFYDNNLNALGDINVSTGAYTALSDINKKKDFEESTIGLNAILGLKPTLYRMKSETNTQKHLGFIAQEVRQYIPNAYVENGEFIGLNEMPIIAALTKAIQELKQEIDTLKN